MCIYIYSIRTYIYIHICTHVYVYSSVISCTACKDQWEDTYKHNTNNRAHINVDTKT